MSALTDHRGTAHRRHASGASGLFIGISQVLGEVRRSLARNARRRELRALVEGDDPHLLRDIGLTREQACREADKWPWQR